MTEERVNVEKRTVVREEIGVQKRVEPDTVPVSGTVRREEAVIDKTGSKLNLHKFDLEASLEKAGVDYLFVTSRPPLVELGKLFKYTPVVKSKKGGVTYKVESGPKGLAISRDGLVRWEVAADFAENTVDVIVSVGDSAGQEVFHTFQLAVGP